MHFLPLISLQTYFDILQPQRKFTLETLTYELVRILVFIYNPPKSCILYAFS